MRGGSHPDGTTDVRLHLVIFRNILHDEPLDFRRQFVRDANTRTDIKINTHADFAFIRLRHDFRTNQFPKAEANHDQNDNYR